MNNTNGGYYAIKGFLYQFDKTLIEILQNPDKTIGIEKRQDIDIQDYVIQVKHKETQHYSPSKINKAVIQLLELFKKDKTQKFCLYCYFKGKSPSTHRFDLTELDNVLGDKREDYTSYLKEEFISSFEISFSNNFEEQFEILIDLIKESFSLRSKDKAYIYHSVFRAKLFDISIKDINKREISKQELDSFIQDTERTIFYLSYAKYLNRDKYETLIKKEFFTFDKSNIDNFERLFLIDCHYDVNLVDINKIVNRISQKYFRKSKSPQPYLCFLNLDNQKIVELKQELIDQGIMFNDGTYFDGDRFRLDRIREKEIDNDNLKIKILCHEHLFKLFKEVKIKEVFHFYLELPDNPLSIDKNQKYIKVQIEETHQILKML
jgi:hypothetical protein